MSHHCDEKPATVGELIEALSKLDPSLPVYETWNESPGWFDFVDLTQEPWSYTRGREDASSDGVVWIGIMKCEQDEGVCKNAPTFTEEI